MIFIGLATNYRASDILRHLFAFGSKRHHELLESALASRYGATRENTALVYSGRTALALALESFLACKKLRPGDHVALNAFTCHAVLEAVQHAGLTPVFVDLAPSSPNYSAESLATACAKDKRLKVFILQNTFGLPVDIESFLEVKQQYNLLLIEDLAHCAGRFYKLKDGKKQEIGTVGEATCLSFGKGKAIDTITGGAVILRDLSLHFPESFAKSALARPGVGDRFRARHYPLFAATAREMAYFRLEKLRLWFLLKCQWIARSADTALDETLALTNWQARLALRQLKNLKDAPLREHFLVENRDECLNNLRAKGYRLEETWYEVPVAPARYYASVNFPEKSCPNAVFFAAHVINLPTWYHDRYHSRQVAEARKIIKTYEVR